MVWAILRPNRRFRLILPITYEKGVLPSLFHREEAVVRHRISDRQTACQQFYPAVYDVLFYGPFRADYAVSLEVYRGHHRQGGRGPGDHGNVFLQICFALSPGTPYSCALSFSDGDGKSRGAL